MALMPIDPDSCPDCGSELVTWLIRQPALFFHAGYGADRQTIEVVCGTCGWAITREVREAAPR